jgi:acetoin utilization deacetylase AcuC-like enzyme
VNAQGPSRSSHASYPSLFTPSTIHAVKIFYTDHYLLPLPAGHRFPIAKYSLLRKCVEKAGLAGGQGLHEPHAATDEEILRAHDCGYLERVVSGQMSAQELA